MRDYIEQRALEIGEYIVEEGATVRQAAKKFGISKSTVHMVVTIGNGWVVRLFGWCPMNTIEVLTLLLVIFAALSYIDNHNNKKK